jgi:hypothetical protein
LFHSSLVGVQMPVKSVHSLEGMVADLLGEERSLSMGSLMPLSVVWSAELFVTDTEAVGLPRNRCEIFVTDNAAVGLPRHRWIFQVDLHMT